MTGRDHFLRRGVFRSVVLILFMILIGNIFVMMVVKHTTTRTRPWRTVRSASANPRPEA